MKNRSVSKARSSTSARITQLVALLARLDADDYLTACANDSAAPERGSTNPAPLPAADKAA